MADLFKGKKLFRGDKEVDPSELQNKIVGLYFSAHWCPPCRNFTPVLKEFYDEVKDEPFEVIFVTSDRSEKEYLDYYNSFHGLWLRLEFNDPMIKNLKVRYNVTGIPMLIIINDIGSIIDNNGRACVTEAHNEKDVVKAWLARSSN